MTDLNKTAASFDLFSKVLFVVDYNEEEIRHRAVETAAAEADCTREVPAKNVKLFCDRTGNYDEVIVPSGCDTACGCASSSIPTQWRCEACAPSIE